jgi:tetratricopeptide (TPR) repeat protein
MELLECYRCLGVPVTATVDEVKAAYRKLARRFHPDVNPDNREAQEKFIQVTEAYDVIMRVLAMNPTWGASQGRSPSPPSSASRPPVVKTQPAKTQPASPQSTKTPPANPTTSSPNTSTPQTPPANPGGQKPVTPPLSMADQQLKQSSYQKLQTLLHRQQFAKATALIEGWADRLSQDPEVKQWQAITYQSWGRHLITTKQPDKARALLKKALHTDPHNRSLWSEVDRDFRRLDRM